MGNGNGDGDGDGDGDALLGGIEEALVAGGYERAREPNISPFDKITGGLAWLVSASKVDVDYEYSDDFVLGDKIQVAESIEFALQRMRCPFPLQAHQMRGLDYPAVYPVVDWLAKRLRNDQEPKDDGEEKRKPELHASDALQDASTVCKDGNSFDEKIAALHREIELHEEKLFSLKRGTSTGSERESNAELGKLMIDIFDHEKFKHVLETLKSLKAIEKKKPALLEGSRCKQEELQMKLNSLLSNTDAESGDENKIEKKNRLRREMAEVSRDVILLQRRLDDVPTQSELIQYERCFMELYINIQAKLRETRKYFASYNALAEVNELSLKEVSLLNSINSQYELAMSTPQGRAKFAESMQGISTGVEKRLKKMEVRCADKRSTYNALREKHGAALATRRQYYALIKQLQEEFARNEQLQDRHFKGIPV